MNKNELLLLGELAGKVDSLIVDVKAIREASGVKDKDLSKRVGNLEKKQYTLILGCTAVWSFGLAWVKGVF